MHEGVYRPWKRAWATNPNTSSFAAIIPTITEPTGDGLLDLATVGGAGGVVPCRLRVKPIGLGSDNNTFDLRVYGWSRIGSGAFGSILWMPDILCSLSCTLSAMVGIAASPVLATERFCDTIAVASEPTITADVTRLGTLRVYSPANDTAAWFDLEFPPYEKLEFLFDQTSGTPTMNVLYCWD